jgi:hypothetical protein
MDILYSKVEREKLIDAWNDGFSANLTAEALNVLRDRIDQFNAMFDTLVEGDSVKIDYLPDRGTSVSINGVNKGNISGFDFQQALLKIWLGDKPVTDSLKKAMLGLMDLVFKTHVERVDTTVSNGDTIDALGGLQVIHVPGHTPGSIALYQPQRHIMFFGDIIFNEGGLKVAPKIFNVDTAKVTEAAHKLAAYDIDIACFGHGEPYTENAGERIRQFLQGGS